MTDNWQHQIRIYLPTDLAEIARQDPEAAALKPLADLLRRHQATLVSQFDAFTRYVTEAENADPGQYPLYKWTKATIQDPEKRAKHIGTFAVRIADNEVYDKPTADALQTDLEPLVGGGLVTRLSRHNTNPTNNLPVPAEYRS